MLILCILATIICGLGVCGSIIKIEDADGCGSVLGCFIAAALESLPIVAIWVLYGRI